MKRLVPIALDLTAVVVFAVIGRASHGLDPLGVVSTAWPFLAACLIAWVALGALGNDGRGARAAIIVWLTTLLAGMALRIASGDTAAPAFFIVATLFLGGAFGGWRVVDLLRRRRYRPA
ncbi:DUF3054 domain-containing protein [Tessaracoccus flavus]|uniref:Uncharacterized protein n=1 Tax=Tessaracoccus flavus TaxID=1610493 RepID=A0A1Q2CEB1_9ACTN|nr:DUF3054 domain-containing protein [Tessaracoccus flavus]AQP44438.1 hypothetical protein RPIT_06105 [Tessaracoccus flavus]SDY69349.1 Protein of unknown function [Tessaracoccus flavus]